MISKKLFLVFCLGLVLAFAWPALASLGTLPDVGQGLVNQVPDQVSITPVASPDGTFWGWLAVNWIWLLPILILVVDKIVAITPTPYDDLIVTGIKGGLRSIGILKSPKI